MEDILNRTIALINTQNFIYNLKILKAKAKNKLMITVKANAYGHSDYLISVACEENGVDYLGVATIKEGMDLRSYGIDLPILVIGGTLTNDYPKLCVYNLDITIYSMEQIHALGNLKSDVNVHLKLDTGMGRIGVDPSEIALYLDEIGKFNNLKLVGISTHLAVADEDEGEEYTKKQLDRFNEAVKVVKERGLRPMLHFANSAATFTSPTDYDEDFVYMNRVGISAYGYSSVDVGPNPLKKVMEIKSRICGIKTIKKGECVSYGCEFTAKEDTLVALVPIGYGDGYKRSYKKGYMIVNGQKAKILGRVCMDHTMIDISKVKYAEVGDLVTCMGAEGDLSIWADDLARLDDTISYEVLTSFTQRVERLTVEE